MNSNRLIFNAITVKPVLTELWISGKKLTVHAAEVTFNNPWYSLCGDEIKEEDDSLIAEITEITNKF